STIYAIIKGAVARCSRARGHDAVPSQYPSPGEPGVGGGRNAPRLRIRAEGGKRPVALSTTCTPPDPSSGTWPVESLRVKSVICAGRPLVSVPFSEAFGREVPARRGGGCMTCRAAV